ncbi:hypothetical protein AMTRI_Chr03g54020 [Amborella trichopoda]
MLFRVFLCFFSIAISLYLHYCKNCGEGLASLSLSVSHLLFVSY